jgi:CheY-like chemotaxis protein
MPNARKNQPNQKAGAPMSQILIVDDDDSVRKLLRFRLKDSYDVIDTASPEDALALALQHKPDAILLDLMMPGYSGFEICQTLSSMSFTQHIPILIVSGESSARYKDFCENLGAKGFFQKPVEIEPLKKKLDQLIDGGRQGGHSKPRIRLRILLQLRWVDPTGAPLELVTVTDNVSTNGFLCACQAQVEEGAIVDVYLAKHGYRFVGKARIVRVDWPGTTGQRCDFQFDQRPTEWILL